MYPRSQYSCVQHQHIQHSHIRAFHRPATLEEASELLADPERHAIVLAGATELGLRIRSDVRELVDISGLGLDRVRLEADGLHIGAMVRATRLHRDPVVRCAAGDALPEAAASIASEGVRNLTTIGGNVMFPAIWADLPPALRVLAARFRVQGTADRVYTGDDFLKQPPRQILQRGDILTEVVVPAPGPDEGSAFEKLSRTKVDFALVSCAAWVKLSGETVAEARIAAGGFCTPPKRLTETEAALVGAPAGAPIAERAAAEGAPRGSFRASEEYMRHALGVVVERCVRRAAERARGGRP